MKPRLIVHGGAWSIPEKYEQVHINGVYKSVAEVYPDLLNGISALDAVEAAVRILEEDPTFDAGRGAFLNAIGEIELDAMIMDGSTLDFGALVAVQNILHPISLARKIMEETEHNILAGTGAQMFAQTMGVKEVNPEELLTPRELKFYKEIKNDPNFKTKNPFEPFPKGTVGAVALDTNGNLAAATSTGGTPRKLPGRVGDSPIIGAGTYADNQSGACSATGWGEAILKSLLSKTTCDYLNIFPAHQAANLAIDLMEQRVQGWGGVILIDKNGNYGFSHNTEKMAFAFADESGKIISKIKIENK
ncbi:isoaspartyl peptidase/L-asparaginase [candidate division KSB1 bacterium]|nr:isoaspartyl peptidase/L-asparaginase [candidate division KSB1 bacterium]MBL7093135.1 isoaspartyl peptidase/L-asparaginase [candidate division KSB1 bacterium]